MQGKLSVIEIARYSYGRCFFLLPFQNLDHDGRKKKQTPQSQEKAVTSLRFVVKRRFKVALCDVRLSLRHLGHIKVVSTKVYSFKVARTM